MKNKTFFEYLNYVTLMEKYAEGKKTNKKM